MIIYVYLFYYIFCIFLYIINIIKYYILYIKIHSYITTYYNNIQQYNTI